MKYAYSQAVGGAMMTRAWKRSVQWLLLVVIGPLFAPAVITAQAAVGANFFVQTVTASSHQWGESGCVAADGGYAVTGSLVVSGDDQLQFLLLKYDVDGNLQWGRRAEFYFEAQGSDIKATVDGGFIVSGYYRYGGGYTEYQMYLLKFTSGGNLEWGVATGDYMEYAYAVQQTADGGYIVAGCTGWRMGGVSGMLLKYEPNGRLRWVRSIDPADSLSSVCQSADGGYLVVGNNSVDGNRNIQVVKCGADGGIEWGKTIDFGEWDFGHSVCQSADGSYLVSGETDSVGGQNQDYILMKFNANGGLIWARSATANSSGYIGNSVQPLADGGCVVAGGSGDDALLLKYDSNGALEWARRIWNSAGRSRARTVQQTADGGFMLAGETQGYLQVLLAKLNGSGLIPDCANVEAVNLSAGSPEPTLSDGAYSEAMTLTSNSISFPLSNTQLELAGICRESEPGTPTWTPTWTPTPTTSPTPTATATATPTWTPTLTPTAAETATPEPSPSLTPEATATPVPTLETGTYLTLNQDYFAPGDPFHLSVQIVNGEAEPVAGALFILLDPGIGEYWFWPSWRHFPPDVDAQPVTLAPGASQTQTVLDFTWPDTAGAALEGVFFWGALVDPGMKIVGGVGAAGFAFGM